MNATSSKKVATSTGSTEQKVAPSVSAVGPIASSLLNLTNTIREGLGSEVEAQVIAVFFLIGSRSESSAPLSVLEVSREASIAESSASRIVSILGRGLRGREGLGLVETREDPNNWSRKQIFLTTKGTKLINEVGSVMINSVAKWGK
jgi:DNA-binding MarR family transcriptional regulator